MIHFLAKKALEENKYIIVPSFSVKTGNYSEKKKVKFEKISIERDFKDIRPDIIAWKDSSSFCFIEIVVTHKVDEEKLRKIKEYSISTLEIDLGDYYKNTGVFDYNEFKDILLNQVFLSKNWIFDKKFLEKRKEEKLKAAFSEKNEKAVKIYITKKNIGILWSTSYDWLNGTVILDGITFLIICKNNKNSAGKTPKFKIDLKTADKEYLSCLENCKEITFENVGAIWQKDNIKTGYINFRNFKYRIKIIENQNRVDRKSPEYLINILSMIKS